MKQNNAILIFITSTALFFALEYLLIVIGVVTDRSYNTSILATLCATVSLLTYLSTMKHKYTLSELEFALNEIDRKIESVKNEFASPHLTKRLEYLRREVMDLKHNRALVQIEVNKMINEVQKKLS